MGYKKTKGDCLILDRGGINSFMYLNIWMEKLLRDFKIKVNYIKVYEDNQVCIALVNTPENNKRIKHIDIKFNYICEYIRNGEIKIEYVNTLNQKADVLTKGLTKQPFQSIRSKINIK